ncbi:hypothetical protein EFL26_06190 [Nocardioides pocheonensis]|uniref:Septum formation initiator n=2 Tax=Nocardioides pocheonensis TaxID=661485 RepID=A0A3N0GUH3_9ACTN|nr:hypothetical protein EFL26_06190 [Nocardioides pocheonensis]
MWTLAVSLWVAIVIVGSAVTWLAIDRAGQQVTGRPSASETKPPVVGTLGPAPVASALPSTPSPSSPAHTRTPTARPSRTPSSTAPPSARPTGSGPTKQASPSTKTAAPAQRIETRTWTGSAGFVTVSCTGSLATLKGASPADGWSYERGDDSGDSVEVKFTNGGTEVQVHATCVGGTPQFHVESGSSADEVG